jgi:hypothetical protein
MCNEATTIDEFEGAIAEANAAATKANELANGMWDIVYELILKLGITPSVECATRDNVLNRLDRLLELEKKHDQLKAAHFLLKLELEDKEQDLAELRGNLNNGERHERSV